MGSYFLGDPLPRKTQSLSLTYYLFFSPQPILKTGSGNGPVHVGSSPGQRKGGHQALTAEAILSQGWVLPSEHPGGCGLLLSIILS